MSTYTGIPLLTLSGVRDSISQAVADGATTEVAASCYYDKLKDILQYNPSWVMMPSFLKDGKAYTMISGLSGSLNVTRTTTPTASRATRVNASGFIETVTDNVLRLDYPIGGGCPALLVEPSAQNLALQSENFGTTWSPNQLIAFGSGSVLNTTGTLDPYGTNVSDLIVASTVSGVQHRIDQTTTSASGSYTFSVFVKAAGYNFTWLRIGTVGAFFNLSNGAITGTSAGIVASSQNYGNGWYRCIISKASSSANEVLRINIIQTDGVTDFAGDGTSGIYVFGAQYETGTVATTYIPTTSGTGSRAADVISASGALVSGLIGQTEGTIYAEVDLRSLPSGPFLTISDGTDANRIQLSFLSNTVLIATIRVGGVNHNYSATIPAIPSSGGIYKVTLGYAANNYCFALNGVTYSSTATRPVPACSVIGVGTSAINNAFFNDRIRAAALYTTRLSNDQLANLTRLT